MPVIPIQLRPGIDTQSTPASSPTGWNESRNIRFFQGLAQKAGGFLKFCQAIISPTDPNLGRSAITLRAWAALSGIRNLSIGGENRISLYQGGTVTDITPLTRFSIISIALSTTIGSATVTVHDILDAPAQGDWVRFRAPISVGGIIVLGSYQVMSITDLTHYTIQASVMATGAVTDGGAARVFTTTLGSHMITVTLPNHGLFTGQVDRISDPVQIAGLTLEGNYVVTVVNLNTYTIMHGEAHTANATTTVTENGGNIALTFFNPAGGMQAPLEVESIDLDNWGEFLLAMPQGEPVFVWMPTNGPSPMQLVSTAPLANTGGFVSAQQQILVMYGSVNFATGLFDPLLVRWSDSGDYTQFTPLPANQAGSFRLQMGSAIIGGLSVAGRGLLWTDIGVYAMQYEQPPLVWGFQPIGVNCGLIGPKAMGVLGETVAWMSQGQFYVLAGGGSPQVIPCSVWDQVFKNIDQANARQSVCVTNAVFGEIVWYVPQSDGTITKARMNNSTGTWDYTIIQLDELSNRSAGIDQNVFGGPFGASPSGAVYSEETGMDADTDPLPWRMLSGIATIAQGDQVAFFREIIPDFKFSNDTSLGPGTVKMMVYVYRDPQAAPRVKGPYLINARTRSVPCRGRGRGLQFEFSGDDKGSAPRLGLVSYRAQADGRGG